MPPPKLKSKEQQVLEQQRRLAASMKQKKQQQEAAAAKAKAKAAAPKQQRPTKAAPSAVTTKKPTLNYKRPHSSSSSQQAQAQAAAPAAKRPASASAVLAAARNKASAVTAAHHHKRPKTTRAVVDLTLTTTTTTKKSPAIPRQPPSKQSKQQSKQSNQKKTKTSAFSSLVQTATTTASSHGDDTERSTLATVLPDDYWKHLRDWDFVQDVYQQQQQQLQNNNNNQKQNQKHDTTTNPVVVSSNKAKALPDIFVSARHYVAAWAPLCHAETRAQLLSEWLSNSSSSNSGRSGMAVTATLTDQRGGGGGSRRGGGHHPPQQEYSHYDWHRRMMQPDDSVCLKLDARSSQNNNNNNNNNKDLSFMTNDMVLLVPLAVKDLFLAVLNNTYTPTPDEALSSNPFKKWGILVGHAKTTRKTPHDLIVEVSKRKWALVPSTTCSKDKDDNNKDKDNNKATNNTSVLWIWKLGANVTALREFTALCRMDQLPLKRFLLGQHLEKYHHHHHGGGGGGGVVASMPKSLSQTTKSKDFLEQLGGSQALGKGFTQYAQNKFNPSQLMAIAASAHEYGEGGFTLIKGPPGTGKTTTLCAVLNSLHIRQYNKYYDQVREIAKGKQNRQFALELARKSKPRLLVCAPSNAAVDNIILKIMEDGFVDGQGKRYNPSMIRIGVGQSGAIRRAVSLEQKVDAIFSEYQDVGALEGTINKLKKDLQQSNMEITKCRRRVHAIEGASPWPLSKDWEIRIDEESFDQEVGGGKVYFVNHRDKSTTFEVPPPPEPDEHQYAATAMPEYRALMSSIVKLVEQCFSIKKQLERCTIVKGSLDSGAHHMQVRQSLELHVLNEVHITMTTLGTAGGRALEGVDKFEVVVIDEAAQSVEPATLSALQLGSRHCVLVGDPQQLPATIFNVSGKTTKYDRSLFQRLEEAKQPVHMLEEQYRMHPMISHFPRHIFYDGNLRDGPNVLKEGYGNPLRQLLAQKMPRLQPFTVLDLDSKEERGGTSLANSSEAHLAVHLYNSLNEMSGGYLKKSKVAIITPYSQQTRLLHRTFESALGPRYETMVEVNTVDAYQGREANVVIFSAVRAAGSRGIGFLSDVRRMNVAVTRAKHFLLVIARCQSIVVNPYWSDLVEHARENQAVLRVPIHEHGNRNKPPIFGHATDWQLEGAERPPEEWDDLYMGPGVSADIGGASFENALADLASLAGGSPSSKPTDPRRGNLSKKASEADNDQIPADPRRKKKDQKPVDPRQKQTKTSGGENKREHKASTIGTGCRLDPRKQDSSNASQATHSHATNTGGRGYPQVQSIPLPPPPPRPPVTYATHSHATNTGGRGYPQVQNIPPPPPPPPPPLPPANYAAHIHSTNTGDRGYAQVQNIPPPPPPPPPPRPPPPPPPPRRPADPHQNISGDPRRRGY